jgi:hypothetical protein
MKERNGPLAQVIQKMQELDYYALDSLLPICDLLELETDCLGDY